MPPEGFLARKPGDRRGVAERVQQLDLGVGQVDEDHGDAVLWLVLRRADGGAEGVAVLRRRCGEVRHRDRDVVEAADHREPPATAPIPRPARPRRQGGRWGAGRGKHWQPRGFRPKLVAGQARRRESERAGEPREDNVPKVSMTVNGRPASGEVEGRTLLVEFLRDGLRLTGTHVGCDTAPVRRLRRARRRPVGEVLQRAGARRRRRRGAHDRGDGQPGRLARRHPGGVPDPPRAAVRLLHPGHGDDRGGAARPRTRARARRRSASISTATSAAAPATTTSSRRSRRRRGELGSTRVAAE